MGRKADDEKGKLLTVFSERIKEAMADLDITQEQLGGIIGVSKQSISSYVTGAAGIDILTLTRLARVLGVSTDYLLGLSKRKDNHPQFTLIDAQQLLGLHLGACLNLYEAKRAEINEDVFGKISDYITSALALYGEYDEFAGGKETGILSFGDKEA